ncbi:hypothetical protein KO465_00795 [Candidatus Micrarchaeota archaeon]|jgi:hypothetical protein|nr:hypothetical protein [Candidatus Micrarchaeota archaeon]
MPPGPKSLMRSTILATTLILTFTASQSLPVPDQINRPSIRKPTFYEQQFKDECNCLGAFKIGQLLRSTDPEDKKMGNQCVKALSLVPVECMFLEGEEQKVCMDSIYVYSSLYSSVRSFYIKQFTDSMRVAINNVFDEFEMSLKDSTSKDTTVIYQYESDGLYEFIIEQK